MRTAVVGVALALAAPALASAQMQMEHMPESYRQVQVNMLELQRHVLLAMADSMPENLYTDRQTPIQRTFAEQLHHCASALVMITTGFAGVDKTGAPPTDFSPALNTKAGMRAYLNNVYDWATAALKQQSAADREAMGDLFGQKMPHWQMWDEVHQHTFWTTGAVVANFRKHGMAPPGFGFF